MLTLNEILHYWIVWVFGIIGMFLVWVIKKPYQQYIQYKIEKEQEKKKEAEWGRNAFKTEMKEAFEHSISEADARILEYVKKEDDLLAKNQSDIFNHVKKQDIFVDSTLEKIEEQLKLNKKGLLSIQGKIFKDECQRLLKQETITIENMNECTENHSIYNDLGGNHAGDELFKLVEEKFKKGM